LLQKARELSRNLAIYGIGDVAVSAVNFLLLPIYVEHLSEVDYAVLALLGSVEIITKIVFRWGLDGSFMRFFYDCDTPEERQRLASTIFIFLLAVNGILLAAALAMSGPLADYVVGGRDHALALRLVLINTFVNGFTFFPFHVLRMENRTVQFSALALARSLATVVLRIILIIQLGMGVLGVVAADIVVTSLFLVLLARWFVPLLRPMFSWQVLRESLAFGLPRIPHGLAQQVMATADKFMLKAFLLPSQLGLLGVYSIGVSFGLTQKLFLAAFESAWAPFYYATAKEKDAPVTFSRLSTYCIAVLALLTAGLSAIAQDLLNAMTHGQYVAAAAVVGWTSLGVFFQGLYLVTSIGLNITKHTRYYPASTVAAAATCVALNFVLIPRYGISGAACANAIASALQTGLAYHFSQRFYPIRYEGGRIARALAAAGIAFAAGVLVPASVGLAGVVVRGMTVVALFIVVLVVTGFFRRDEMQALRRLAGRQPRTSPIIHHETTEYAGQIVSTDITDDAAEESETKP
jgi:O-antigen/teichoic acid export membrane protein